MATWSTWRKCTGFSPVTPGGAGIHLSSAGKGYGKQFSPLICHTWDCISDCIHTCTLDYSSTWKVLANGFESCRRHHAGQVAGPQGVWRGWGLFTCSACREGFGLSSRGVYWYDEKQSKVGAQDFQFRREEYFFTVGAGNWKRRCWWALGKLKAQLDKALICCNSSFSGLLDWMTSRGPSHPGLFCDSAIPFSFLMLLSLFSKRSDSFRNGSSCWLYASGGNVNGEAAALLAPW